MYSNSHSKTDTKSCKQYDEYETEYHNECIYAMVHENEYGTKEKC